MSQSDETPYKAPSPYGRDASPASENTPPTPPPAPPAPPAGGNSPYANSPYANSPYGQAPQSTPGASHGQSPYANSPYAQSPYAQGSFAGDGTAPVQTDEGRKKANWGIGFGIIGLFFFQLLFGILAIVWGKKANALGGNGKPAIILGCVDLAFFVIAVIYGLSNR